MGLKDHERVTAAVPTIVPAIEPVPLGVGKVGVQPGEIVVVVAVAFHAWSTQS